MKGMKKKMAGKKGKKPMKDACDGYASYDPQAG
jgi:hypothetical protein